MSNTETLRIRVYGIVQGVGFRPTVYKHAVSLGILGTVSNCGPYVEIIARADKDRLEEFINLIKKEPPKRAAILRIISTKDDGNYSFSDFQIVESEKKSGDIFISPDIAICEECKQELYNPEDKRYLHPFINCTCCGPRMTIIESLPYDRVRTSMKKFKMCPDCEKEYNDPATRRHDAQPVCCNECGPQVYALGRSERGAEAITLARQTIAEGGIIAVKGIGGFHLCCDATNEETVKRLRTLKNRPVKPFAVMARNLSTAARECRLNEELTEIINGHQKPILLLRKRRGGRVAPSVAPGSLSLGLMLPYAPIHLLLFDYDDCVRMPDFLVMTSGNESGAPIIRDDEEAIKALSGLCDMILSHDRDIRVRADDTVMDVLEGHPYMIRRSRGYAPLPFMMDSPEQIKHKSVVGIGGELKNSFTIGKGELFYPSAYIGDLTDIRCVDALKESLSLMESLLEARPEVVCCDMHPLYNSRMAAHELGIKVIEIQHHYAHVLSCMAENNYLKPVIGVSFDGTGYGTDKTIWGGEILIADLHGFKRYASVKPFKQVGGDSSAREGYKIAVSLINSVCASQQEAWEKVEALELCDKQTYTVLTKMADKNINTITSTSAGRLFDAVSAILGIRRASTFEGEASMALQTAAEKWKDKFEAQCITTEPEYSWEYLLNQDSDILRLNTPGIITWITEKKLAGEDTGMLAFMFHKLLSKMVAKAAVRARESSGINVVALSGGVYQNTLMVEITRDYLEKYGFEVLRHSMIPPNDGGLSLGQALYATYNED